MIKKDVEDFLKVKTELISNVFEYSPSFSVSIATIKLI